MTTKRIFLIGIFGLATAFAAQLTGREILDKAIHRYRGDDSILTVQLKKAKLSNPNDTKTFNITTYRKVRPDVVKALVAVSKSDDPNARPVLFLIWDWQDKKKEDQIWYCLPSIGKYDRINSAKGEEMSQKFGFSIDEMRSRDLDNATHTLEGEVTETGEKCYKVVSAPKDTKKEGFKQITSWIRIESFTPVKIEYVALDGKVEKRLVISRLEKIQDIWTEMGGHFEDYLKDSFVSFEVKKIEYNPKLSNELFNFTTPPAQFLK